MQQMIDGRNGRNDRFDDKKSLDKKPFTPFYKPRDLPIELNLKEDLTTEGYNKWVKNVVLWFEFHRTPRDCWAIPLYRACQKSSVQYFLKDMTIDELRSPTALNEILKVLNRRYIQPAENRIGEYRKDYERFMRPQFFPMEQYINHLEYLEAKYLKEDVGAAISPLMRAMALLERAGLDQAEKLLTQTLSKSVGKEWHYDSIRNVLLM